MDAASAGIVAWLRAQPKNATIAWASDHCSAEQPWACGWVDVHVPAACSALKMHWIWTIVGPDNDEEMDPEVLWAFIVPYDCEEYSVYDPEPPNQWFIDACSVPIGHLLDPREEQRLATICSAGPNRSRAVRPGWTTSALSAALTAWAATHARRTDLTFLWNPELPESVPLQRALETNARRDRGEETTYDLGGNIQASEQVMNFFLEDPDRAAQIMREFRKATGTDEPAPL